MWRRALVWLFAFGSLSACAHVRMEIPVPAGTPPITLEYPRDLADDARYLRETFVDVWPRFGVFGPLTRPTTIVLHRRAAEIQRLAGLADSPWLRAWATYSRIDLQTPGSWEGPGLKARLGDLMTHELTHLAMYQRCGKQEDWHERPLPFWLREGLATYAAGLGDNLFTRERLRAFYLSADFPGDPILEADTLIHSHPRETYAASFHFVTFIVERFGREPFGTLLDRIGAGRGFLEAWQSAFPVPFAAVFGDWRNDLLSAPAPHRSHP